jgi:hypothetical protein
MNFEMADIKKYGFQGFKTIASLKSDGYDDIPKQKGVYLVIRNSEQPVVFLNESIGGRFKGRNPTIPVEELKSQWVNAACVVYIGKAGREGSKATLRSRLKQYMEFGKGRDVGHWGGRYIWQIQDSDDFLIAWKPLTNEEPDTIESALIEEFRNKFGKRPFANLAK